MLQSKIVIVQKQLSPPPQRQESNLLRLHHTDMNSVPFLFPALISVYFLISLGSTEHQEGYDSKNPPWENLFEPFEPGKCKETTPPPLYKRIFKSVWNKAFGHKTEAPRNRYHCMKSRDHTVHVIAKYFHYTFTMKRTTRPNIKDLFTKIPFVRNLFKV